MKAMSDPASEGPARTPRPPSTVRLLLLVLEGYAYIAFVVAVLIAVPGLLLLGLLDRRPFVALAALFVGVPLLLVVRKAVPALFFRIPPPDGVRVTAADAPLLFAEMERTRQAVRAPRVHEVHISGDFNASAVQLARFGIFWPRNYLLIGLPLFATLSPAQMRAVIAHELAHLSRSHGRVSLLVYRLRWSWARLLDALDMSTPTFALVLFRWYAPRLHAHSTALARRHELVVDRLAAQVAGTDAAAETILALGVVGPLYEDALWTDVSRDEAESPGPYSRPQPDVWSLVATEGEARLASLVSETTGLGDSHPSLGERLAAIGATPRIPARPDRAVGDVWLGAQMATIAARLDEQWTAARNDGWRRRREHRRERRERLATLEGVATPSPAEIQEKAELIEALEGVDAALPLYERAADGGHAAASLAVGRIRLERDDDSGVALIEQAMANDPSLGTQGHRLIADFYESRGRLVDANRHATLARAATTRASLAAGERREVSAVDRFGTHGLDQPALDRIVATLTRAREVHAAFLVRKELRYSEGSQLVLAVEANGAAPSLHDELVAEGILPAEGTIVTLGRHDAALRQAIATTPASEIYRRG
jgi:Zn-dependent protease with chaperone function